MSIPILIAYDGSAGARHAVEETARLFPGASAVVLYARPPLESLAAHLEGHALLEDLRDIDAKTYDASERLAAEGAEQARGLGLKAEPRVASVPEEVAAEAIVDVAEEIDAALIVLGSRGRQGVKALLTGSTSTRVMHSTGRPTLVIPSRPLAAARREARRFTDR
ncbi:universal stress protein [Nonomuraea spiralis]|uniref:universal stress protein n=1 Tax=Nonomuraea TaxID=83681 RepID=UPI000F76892E|nr:universal stress protein [Nonomuraea sp. WAC 01424]RSN12639.1 universal stress protein [Nonomuraea sp. WAC 01424]